MRARVDARAALERAEEVSRVLEELGEGWVNNGKKKPSIEEAVAFIQEYREEASTQPFARYEIEVLYNNQNKMNGQFQDKVSAVQFLRDYAPPAPRTLAPLTSLF